MELRVLSAAGMRESRAGIRVVGRRMHARFRALDSPPTRGKSLCIAQLHAAASLMRFLATAKAAACRNFPEQSGCVREQRERASQENGSQERCPWEDPTRDGLGKEPTHGGHFAERPEKNRWSSKLENLVTWVLEPSGKDAFKCGEHERLPALEWREFRIETTVRIWRWA